MRLCDFFQGFVKSVVLEPFVSSSRRDIFFLKDLACQPREDIARTASSPILSQLTK